MDKEYNKQIGLRIFKRRKELKLTRAELGKKLSLHESTIKRYEDGEIKSIDIDKIKEFAEALGTSVQYLMGLVENNDCDRLIDYYYDTFEHVISIFENFGYKVNTSDADSTMIYDSDGKLLIHINDGDLVSKYEKYKIFTNKQFISILLRKNGIESTIFNPSDPDIFDINEFTLVEKYQKLDVYSKNIVDTIINLELKRKKNSYDSESDIIQLPLATCKASAGKGYFLFDGYPDNTIDVIFNNVTAKASECIEVSGDSMQPLYYNNDILLVKKQPNIDEGEIGIFIKNGNGYVKKKGPDRLISLNREYPDIYPEESSEIVCYGKVIGKLKKEWIKNE